MFPFKYSFSQKELKLLSVLIAFIGISLTAVEAWYLRQNNMAYIQASVDDASAKATAAIRERFSLYQYGLRSTKGVILATGENSISRRQFVQYSQVRDIDTEFPGARGFGFIRRVDVSDEAAFLERARADGAPSFTIRQLTPNNQERYIIQYIEPAGRNRQAIGLDIGSETNRRKAADDAMRTGTVQLTGPITLVQATGNPKQSFLILTPIYRPHMLLQTQAQRVAAAFGWSYAPLLMEEVLADLDFYDGSFVLELIDVTEPDNPVSFFKNLPTENLEQSDFNSVDNITLFGRTWSVHFTATPEFINRLNLLPHETVLAVGSAASVGLALLFAAFMSSRLQKRRAMENRAALASIVENSFDAIIGRDLEGVITSWNPGATALFGYSEEEALGQPFKTLLVPDTLQEEEAAISRRLSRGSPTKNFETQRRCKDGTIIDVSVTASPIKSDTGQIIGSSKTMRDYTAQNEARRRISEMNTHLETLIAQRTAELTEVNSLLMNILRSASDVAIIATDENGVITVFNTGAEHLFGYSQDEAVDHINLLQLFMPSELDAYASQLSEQVGEQVPNQQALFYKPLMGHATTKDWTHIRKDASEFNASAVISKIQNDDGTHGGFLCVSIDVTSQYKFRRQLESVRNQLEMAAQVAEMGVWSWDIETNKLHWNEHMFKIYGYPASMKERETTFEDWRSRLDPDEVEGVQQRLMSMVDGHGDFDINFHIFTPAGERRVIQTGAEVERTENGRAIRVTGFNRDITDQIQREEILQQAKESADRANRAKSNFLANMSHEIRTPMNAILGMLQLTQQTELTETQNDFLIKAQSSAKALLRILNDILDYSKIEAGKLELDMHEFNLIELLDELGNVLYGNDHNDGIDLFFDIGPDLPTSVISDSLKLQQVLTNLAGNALKFTSNGYVCISVHCVDTQSDAPKRIRFAIEDTGIGISDEQLSRLFTGFTQAEASTTRQFGGTGLGLAISDSIIAELGGKIDVQSTLGQGSIFSFELDFDLPPGSKKTSSIAAHGAQNKRVYLLASTARSTSVHQTSLENMGYDAVCAASSDELIFALSSGPGHDSGMRSSATVVIDEYGLSDDDIHKLADTLSSMDADQTKIVSLSRRQSKLAQTAANLNLRSLHKPFVPQKLKSALEGETNIQNAIDDTGPTSKSTRLEGMNILVVEDNLLNREVAKGLLQNESAKVDFAVNGLEGIEKALAPDRHYDFVVMDVQMPGMDGIQATREIRKFKTKSELPIVAMTANASHADRDECLAAGMNAHLGKPINIDEFVALLVKTGAQTRTENRPSD